MTPAEGFGENVSGTQAIRGFELLRLSEYVIDFFQDVVALETCPCKNVVEG